MFFYAFPSSTKTSTLMDAKRDTRISFLSVKKEFYYFSPSFGLEETDLNIPLPRFFERARTKDGRRNYYYVTSHFSIFPSHEILKREDCATITANGTSNRKRCVLIGTSFFRERGERRKRRKKENNVKRVKKSRRNNKADKLHGRLLFEAHRTTTIRNRVTRRGN